MPEIPLKPEDQELCRIHDYEYEQWGDLQSTSKKQTVTKKVTENNDIEKHAYPTIEEIQKIRDEAFNEGFETGYKEGLAKGKKAGQAEGFDTGKLSGFEQGEKEGLAKGEKEGLIKSKKEIEDAFLKKFTHQNEIWQSIIDRLKSSIDEQDAQLKSAMTQLIVQICRGVFVAEMNLKPEHIKYVVKQVLDSMPNDEQTLQVFVNQDDFIELESVMDFHPNQEMKYTIDNELESGGCYVKAKYSYVDYSMSTRFQQQLKDLMESVTDLDWDTLVNLKKPLPEHEIPENVEETEEATQESSLKDSSEKDLELMNKQENSDSLNDAERTESLDASEEETLKSSPEETPEETPEEIQEEQAEIQSDQQDTQDHSDNVNNESSTDEKKEDKHE